MNDKREQERVRAAIRLLRLEVAAAAVVQEWDERGDGGCQTRIQDDLRAALTPNQSDPQEGQP